MSVSRFDAGRPGPAGIGELMAGARHAFDYVALKPGERVLILAEHGTDEDVLAALVAAAAYIGAEVDLLHTAAFAPGGVDRAEPSPVVIAAHAAADVVIACTWWAEVHTQGLFFTEIPKHRARFLSLHMAATPGALATGARTPPAVFYAIKEAAIAALREASEVRVTTKQGTDLRMRGITTDQDHGPLQPGWWKPFPYGGLNFNAESADGVIVIEESTATGVPDEALSVELKDGRVTAIRGGASARHLDAFGPAGYYLRHAFIGLNPKVRVEGAPQFEREKHAGAFYLGLDGLTDGRVDTSRPGFQHCDCQFDRPTIMVDGRPLVDRGRLLLLDDPNVRAVVEQIGPPDILLDDNPRLVLPARHALGIG